MKKMKIKKGDTVKVIAGSEKGKTGKILVSMPSKDKVIIEGLNLKKKHQKPRKAGQKGEIIEKASPIHVSNVVKFNKKD